MQELRRLVAAGATGLRIQPPVTGPLDDPRATPLWDVANELGLPVDVNLPQQDYAQVWHAVPVVVYMVAAASLCARELLSFVLVSHRTGACTINRPLITMHD